MTSDFDQMLINQEQNHDNDDDEDLRRLLGDEKYKLKRLLYAYVNVAYLEAQEDIEGKIVEKFDDLRRQLKEARAALRDYMAIQDDDIPEEYWTPQYKAVMDRCKAVAEGEG